MAVSARTHYDTLGVERRASDGQIRDAYRRLARQYHPDRVGGSAAGADRMPEVNEAYRVLSDPARRAMYDASLRTGTRSTGSGPSSGGDSTPKHDHGHDDDYEIRLRASRQPIGVPWRSILVVASALIVGIVVLAQFTDGSDGPVIDNILRVGDCAEVLDDGRATEVPCSPDGSGDLVVESMIPFSDRCDAGLAQHQDRQGMGIVCLSISP